MKNKTCNEQLRGQPTRPSSDGRPKFIKIVHGTNTHQVGGSLDPLLDRKNLFIYSVYILLNLDWIGQTLNEAASHRLVPAGSEAVSSGVAELLVVGKAFATTNLRCEC
jgi:hypothetical protein